MDNKNSLIEKLAKFARLKNTHNKNQITQNLKSYNYDYRST